MKQQPIWNTVIPSNVYVILDGNGTLLCEQMADRSHVALKLARIDWGDYAKTAILKTEWQKTQARESMWLKAAKRVEG